MSKAHIISTYNKRTNTIPSNIRLYLRYSRPFLPGVRSIRGPKGDRGIPGFHGQRGSRRKRGVMGKKGEKGADGQCEVCCGDMTAQFPLDEDDQEDERKTNPVLGEAESSLVEANKELVEKDIRSKIRLF